jgi:hypothetical protein
LENNPGSNITAKYIRYMLDSPSYVQAGSFFPDWYESDRFQIAARSLPGVGSGLTTVIVRLF